MTIAAASFDTAAVRPASAPLSAIIRSPTEEPYNATSDLSFGDFLDMVNPLQHIPVVGTIYRAVTGDTIKPAAQVVGDIAYGGPIGGIASIFSAIIAQANGRSVEESMMAAVGLGGEQPTVAVAALPPAAAAPTPLAAAAPAPAAPAPTVAPAAAPASAPAPQPAPASGSRLTDKAAPPIGEHKPGKMPARDTVLANTVSAKQAASLAQKAAPMPLKGPPVGPSMAMNASANGPVPQEMISDVMMRNLAKYEAAKKALNPTTPNLHVAG